MRPTFLELQSFSVEALDALLARNSGPNPDNVAGYLYRGLALKMPAPAFSLLGKFGKAFVKDGAGLRGWNVRMQQNALDDAWRPVEFKGKPVTYGHYRTRPTAPSERHPQAMTIDYALGGNRRLDPSSRIVDYLVAVGGDDLLLGRLYLNLGGRLIPMPSYFVLQRYLPVTATVSPPCPPRAST